MYIARLSLICLVAFVFMVGCGMMGQKAEMSTPATGAADGAATASESKSDAAEAMDKAAVEEVTLNVTGMT